MVTRVGIDAMLKRVLLAAALVIGGLLAAAYALLRASLPVLDGEIAVRGLAAAVSVERDAFGVPTVRGLSRLDVAHATGFLHAQERFFQMDLLRRRAAGELAALVGRNALPTDRRHRLHRLRHVAEQALARLPEDQRALFAAYATGVNE